MPPFQANKYAPTEIICILCKNEPQHTDFIIIFVSLENTFTFNTVKRYEKMSASFVLFNYLFSFPALSLPLPYQLPRARVFSFSWNNAFLPIPEWPKVSIDRPYSDQ